MPLSHVRREEAGRLPRETGHHAAPIVPLSALPPGLVSRHGHLAPAHGRTDTGTDSGAEADTEAEA